MSLTLILSKNEKSCYCGKLLTILSRSDIEGQILRCEERIEENIMPEIFRKKLVTYQKRKEEKT